MHYADEKGQRFLKSIIAQADFRQFPDFSTMLEKKNTSVFVHNVNDNNLSEYNRKCLKEENLPMSCGTINDKLFNLIL